VERSLYRIEDYQRFAGQGAKLKLVEMLGDDSPWVGQRVLLGQLLGLDEQGRVILETEKGVLSFALSQIESAHLLFDWNKRSRTAGKGRRPSASGKARADKRSK
jgi:ribosome maturation factor RimP